MTQLKIDPEISSKAEAAAQEVGVELPEFTRRQMTNQLHAVAMARLLTERAGAGHPVRFFDLREVIDAMDHPEVQLSESAGAGDRG